jgi:N6-L-threonylcarbamoyladenine synthase
MYVLGIETSCDETGLAIYDTEQKTIVAEKLYSQLKRHKQYGGVVPELASRDHIRKMPVLMKALMAQGNINYHELACIAYTFAPGLIGSLMVGAGFAKSLAYSLSIPSLAVHHLEGHLLAPFLASPKNLDYPFVALLVSGGHTQLFLVKSFNHYELLGQSVDDAAGEAFDKTAKLLDLPYPGGPNLAQLASKVKTTSFTLPKPMTDRPGLDFSFSGLKTAVMHRWQTITEQYAQNTHQAYKAQLALAFENAVSDTIAIKCQRAIKQTGCRRLVVSGGVGANQKLRDKLSQTGRQEGFETFFPSMHYCTDNGAMIALAGAMHFQNGQKDPDLAIRVKPRYALSHA